MKKENHLKQTILRNVDIIELLYDFLPHKTYAWKYAAPTSYILVSRSIGIQSQPETNVEELAKSFGALK